MFRNVLIEFGSRDQVSSKAQLDAAHGRYTHLDHTRPPHMHVSPECAHSGPRRPPPVCVTRCRLSIRQGPLLTCQHAPHTLVVPVIRSCQSPIWIWLKNYLHLHLNLHWATCHGTQMSLWQSLDAATTGSKYERRGAVADACVGHVRCVCFFGTCTSDHARGRHICVCACLIGNSCVRGHDVATGATGAYP